MFQLRSAPKYTSLKSHYNLEHRAVPGGPCTATALSCCKMSSKNAGTILCRQKTRFSPVHGRLSQYRGWSSTAWMKSAVQPMQNDLEFEQPFPVANGSLQLQKSDYWRKIPLWQDVREEDFLSYRWQVANTIDRKSKLLGFLSQVIPESFSTGDDGNSQSISTRDAFLRDVEAGMTSAPMSVRLTPQMLSVIDWRDPWNDPIRRQFIPLQSTMVQDHAQLTIDSLHETADSPVQGLVHRYPDKVLFLATSVCPVYCRFCTRSYAVGGNTESVTKQSMKPTRRRWDTMLEYIEKTPAIQDVVISGGDSYYLQPDHLTYIGERLLAIPHIQRFRFATKGLAVCPMRILDQADDWSNALFALSAKGREVGKQVAVHTHFNHPNEISWVTKEAARLLFARGVVVRNQSVLLRGVNDTVDTMSTLIRQLADLNIHPYYVYQADMVKGVEDLRTPLSTALFLEKQLRGTIAGFMMPQFVVDLPGGGGKRLTQTFENYNVESGISTWKAPGVAGDKTFHYYDPIPTIS